VDKGLDLKMDMKIDEIDRGEEGKIFKFWIPKCWAKYLIVIKRATVLEPSRIVSGC